MRNFLPTIWSKRDFKINSQSASSLVREVTSARVYCEFVRRRVGRQAPPLLHLPPPQKGSSLRPNGVQWSAVVVELVG